MTAMTNRNRKIGEQSSKKRSRKWFLGLSALAAFAVCLSVPATINPWDGLVTQSAYAKSDNAGGNGRGNGRGNNGRHGNGNSKAPSPQSDEIQSASRDSGRAPYLLLPLEEITMAMFTTRISKRYPADEVTTLENPHQAISFFSEIKDMAGKQISHLWYFEGELKFTASFNIRANRWRVWSTQLLPEDMAGQWKVEVVDETGTVLETRKLRFVPTEGELLASR